MNLSPESAIAKHHTTYGGKVEGILIFELRTGTGYSAGEPSRIDAFHMEDVLSKGLKRTAYEIKISRSDFMREIKDPRKRRAALRVSNQFYFVTPPGLLKPEEIPQECGLMECGEYGLIEKVNAPYRDGMPPSWLFFASVARRLLKSVDGQDAGAQGGKEKP